MPKGSYIQLDSGQEICLKSLNQCLTYWGLLEGLPTTRMNQSIIKNALEKAIRSNHEGKPPYLIQPTETTIEYRGHGGRGYPFGIPAALPSIFCEACFEFGKPAQDKNKDHSWLIIVWFQKEFALPIDEDVMSQIKALDWNNVAHDDDY